MFKYHCRNDTADISRDTSKLPASYRVTIGFSRVHWNLGGERCNERISPLSTSRGVRLRGAMCYRKLPTLINTLSKSVITRGHTHTRTRAAPHCRVVLRAVVAEIPHRVDTYLKH